MDQSQLLAEFDQLVAKGLVLYDGKQATIRQQDRGLTFQFVFTNALANKPTAATAGKQSKELEKRVRPGSDIDTNGYEVGEIGGSHILVANKFCYARPHYLLLTRDGYQRQYQPLNRKDLAAAWSLLSSRGNDKSVVFFNCGQGAGYSRLHKHMQLMPMPQDTFVSFLDSADGKEPDVPFQWFYQRFSGPELVTVDEIVNAYQRLLEKSCTAIREAPDGDKDCPSEVACSHNLLITTRWMVVIPRRRPSVHGESGANAIGMVGYIAITSQVEMDKWTSQGLYHLLSQFGVPK